MDYKNKELLKIGLDVIKNMDCQTALNELYLACRGKFILLDEQNVKPRIIEEDVF